MTHETKPSRYKDNDLKIHAIKLSKFIITAGRETGINTGNLTQRRNEDGDGEEFSPAPAPGKELLLASAPLPSLTDLEKVFDPPLTSLPLVAPSFFSTPVATSVSDTTLLASPTPPFSKVLGVRDG